MMLYFYPIYPSIVLAVWISCSVVCHGLQIELNIKNSSNSSNKKVKIICVHPSKKFQMKRQLHIRNEGTDLSSLRRNEMARLISSAVSLPNLSVLVFKGFKCYLSPFYRVPKESIKKRLKRVVDSSTASVPAENGVCQPGYRIDQDRCYPCFPGSYTSGQEAECFLCPKDFYSDKEAADSCWPCPEGKKTLTQGANSLDLCIHLNETSDKKWILILTLLALFLILSWIGIVGLIFYICRSRKKRATAKEKSQILLRKKKHMESEVDIKKRNISSVRERSLTKNPSLESTKDRRLENIAEEKLSQTELGIQFSRTTDCTTDQREKLQKNVFEIHSPAKKNYFFINQRSEPIIGDFPLAKGSRNKILKTENFEYSAIGSESASGYSDDYLSAGENSTFIDQMIGDDMDKRASTKLDRKEIVSGKKMKLKKKRTKHMPVKSNHSVTNGSNQESELCPRELEIMSPENSQSQRFENRNNARKKSSSGKGTSKKKLPQKSEKISGNSLENRPIGMTTSDVKLKSGNSYSVLDFPSSTKPVPSVAEQISDDNTPSKKSFKFISSASLYVPVFRDHQLIDLNSDSSDRISVSNTRTGTSHKTEMVSDGPRLNSQQTTEEIKINIEPDSGTEYKRNIWESYLPQLSIFDDVRQLIHEPYLGNSNSPSQSARSSPLHVDLNINFVT